jgi:hypothetical protein
MAINGPTQRNCSKSVKDREGGSEKQTDLDIVCADVYFYLIDHQGH